MFKTKILCLVILISTLYQDSDCGEYSKIMYICRAHPRSNGVWIEDCQSWWDGWNGYHIVGSVWYRFQNGIGFGGQKYIVIAATKFEYQQLVDLKNEFHREWEAELQQNKTNQENIQVNEEKDQIEKLSSFGEIRNQELIFD